MSGFTKLVPEIVQSSIWNESSDIRIVWITMLAIKDENGYVQGDARTISRLANVTQEAASTALELFQKPDPFSHTPDDDGRRIAAAAGGWLVLNHDKYRTGDRTAYMREYMRKYRENKPVNNVNINVSSPSASVSASDVRKEEGGTEEETTDFDAFWKAYPRKVGKAAARKAWRITAKTRPVLTEVLNAINAQKQTDQWAKDGGQFIPHPSTWLNQGRWDDDTVVDVKPVKRAIADGKKANRDRLVSDYQKQIVTMTEEEAHKFMEKVRDNLKDVVAECWVFDAWVAAQKGSVHPLRMNPE